MIKLAFFFTSDNLNTEVKKISYEILTNSCSIVTIGRTDNGMKIKLHILVKYSGENIPQHAIFFWDK